MLSNMAKSADVLVKRVAVNGTRTQGSRRRLRSDILALRRPDPQGCRSQRSTDCGVSPQRRQLEVKDHTLLYIQQRHYPTTEINNIVVE